MKGDTLKYPSIQQQHGNKATNKLQINLLTNKTNFKRLNTVARGEYPLDVIIMDYILNPYIWFQIHMQLFYMKHTLIFTS